MEPSHYPPPGPAAPNGGELLGSSAPPPPWPPVPPSGDGGSPGQRRRAPLALAVVLLVASALVGFGARAGWFDTGGPQPAAVVTPDSRTASSPEASGGIDVDNLADEVEDAIVNITSVTDGGVGSGTGLLVSSDGLVLTNHHVISAAEDLQVEVGGNGEMHDAHVVGYAIDDDVALLQIDDVSGLPTIDAADDVVTSDDVLVMGNALGRGGEPTVSPGTVVGLDRQITASDERGANAETLTGMIQISATVQPGQSGGAVVNADGEVVGMTTAASGDGGIRFGFEEAAGEAYAIPIGRALDVVEEIKGGESTDGVHVGPRGVLGVTIQTQLQVPGSRTPIGGDDGVVVNGVDPDSGAADAGITEGSTILSVDGVDVVTADDVTRAMNQLKPDDEIEVTWLDLDGEQRSASIRLVEGPPL